jgi:ribose 5-phosphate isomerase B
MAENHLMSNVAPPGEPLRVAIGGDHAGFPLKEVVAARLAEDDEVALASAVIDCGTNSAASCDYPDFAVAVAREIVRGNADRGIMVCGSGVGVSVAANKIPGIRAAICHDTYSAHQGVEHDDMNVLCIGGRIIGSELALEIVAAFLSARYTPGQRHQRRLDKVLQIERLGTAALDL